MQNLEAADLSTVYAFPIIGDNLEGNTSHVVVGIFYFFMKNTCKKNHQKSYSPPKKRIRAANKSGSLRGPNLRFVYGLYIFYMRLGR